MSTPLKIAGILSAIIFVLVLIFPLLSQATISGCTINVGPNYVSPNSSGTITFAVDNNDSAGGNVVWVKMTTPHSNITITGGSNSGWTASGSGSSITFTGGTITPGYSSNFSVNVSALSATPTASWTVETSDSADGSGATTCGGYLVIAVSDTPPDTTAPSFTSAITVTAGSGSATFTWTTNEAATSVIDYGATDSYGSSASGGATTDHSITISGLSAGTYHYAITITDTAGNGN